MRTRGSPVLAALFVLVAAALALVGPQLSAGLEALRHPVTWAAAVGPDQAALMAAGLLGWLVLLWLATGLIVMTAASAPGAVGRAAEAVACRLLPASVRQIAAGVLGLSLTTSLAACSQTPSTAPLGSGSTGASRPAAGPWLPGAAGSEVDWPLTAGPPGAPLPTSPAAASAGPTHESAGQARSSAEARQRAGAVVVAAGDSLWLIAARRLGPGASPADVAAETHRWYAANVAVIGANPDLLRPGQVLAAPPGQH